MLREINRILRHRTSFRRTASCARRQFHDPDATPARDRTRTHLLELRKPLRHSHRRKEFEKLENRALPGTTNREPPSLLFKESLQNGGQIAVGIA